MSSSNFSDLVIDAAGAVTDQLMDDAQYRGATGGPVLTRALLHYASADGAMVQRVVRSLSLPVAAVPQPERNGSVTLLNADGSDRITYTVLDEIDRDENFVTVKVRPA